MQGKRFSGRILCRQHAAQGVRHNPGAVSRRRPRAIRQEIRQAGRGRRRVQHGSHDAGLQPGHGNQDRRAYGSRPLVPARPGAAAHSRNRPAAEGSGCGTGCRSHALPAGQAARAPLATLAGSMPSSVRTSAITSPPRRSRPSASSPPPPATPLPSTLPAAKLHTSSRKTARSAWIASRPALTRLCPTPLRTSARCCAPP